MDNHNDPATKGDVARVETRVERIETRVERIEDRMEQMEASRVADVAHIAEKLEAMETKLLGAFFNYQEYARIEMRKMKSDVSNVGAAAELRFDNMEVRLTTLERAWLSNRDKPAQ